MVGTLRPQPDAGAVVQPEPAFLRLFTRDLQPLLPPDSFDPLDVHRPASPLQQRRDAAVAIAAVLGGERDDVGPQGRLIVGRRRRLALRGTMLPQDPARPSFGHAEFRFHMLHTGAAAGGA